MIYTDEENFIKENVRRFSMDNSNDIKARYAQEAITYRKEAPLVNFDAEKLFQKLLWIVGKIYMDPNTKIKVLDIGAGNGMLSELILKQYPNAQITMLDFSPEMLKSAEAYFEENHINDRNIKYVVEDFIYDNLPDETFDLVISSYALHHIRNEEDLKNVFMKIAKVLKDDIGTFICVDMYLETGELAKKRQVQKALDKWEEKFGSKEQAMEWGKILQGEDTPATIPMIIAALYQCRSNHANIIPLLTNESGDMATVYGMTKLSLEEINHRGLYDLVWSWRNNPLPICTVENEHKIGGLSFDSDNGNNNMKKL